MFSVSGSMLEILLYVTYCMLPQKQVTDVSLVLKDSDMESENLSSLIRLSENRQLKSCIIYRYIIKKSYQQTVLAGKELIWILIWIHLTG